MESEFGSLENVRFLPPSCVTAYDAEGNELLCKCGKPIVGSIMGEHTCLNYCADCSPYKDLDECKIVKGKPISEEKLKDMGFVKASWVVDLKEDLKEID